MSIRNTLNGSLSPSIQVTSALPLKPFLGGSSPSFANVSRFPIQAGLHDLSRLWLKLLISFDVGVSFLSYVIFGLAGTRCAQSLSLAPRCALLPRHQSDFANSSVILACAAAPSPFILHNTPALLILLFDSLELLAAESLHPQTSQLAARHRTYHPGRHGGGRGGGRIYHLGRHRGGRGGGRMVPTARGRSVLQHANRHLRPRRPRRHPRHRPQTASASVGLFVALLLPYTQLLVPARRAQGGRPG